MTRQSDPREEHTPAPGRDSRSAVFLAIALFIIVYTLTIPQTTGDTPVYVSDILRYFQGGAASSPSILWEFGHLLWRPAGYGLWHLAHPLLSSRYGGNPTLEITAVLFGLNFLAGVALIPLTFLLCRRLGLGPLGAWAVTAGLLLSSTVLNYVHSGASYNPGLALSLAGQLLIRAVFGGVALALAVALWFPYILSIPASLLIGWFAGDLLPRERRIHLLLITGASTTAAGILLFGAGALICGISSPMAFMHWVSNSAHGVEQNRQLIRLPSGITRSFLNLGDDGLVMKRFVFGDPYAPLRWYDLLRAGLWKVALVFATLAALVWTLARDRAGRRGLSVLALGFVPTLLFALLLFETSEPARYETLYIALIAGICAVIPMTNKSRTMKWLLTAFLVSMILVNLRAYGWDLRKVAGASSERAALLRAHLGDHGIAFLVSFRDPLSTYFQRNPFDTGNNQQGLHFFHVIEPGARRVATWRRDSACRVLTAWDEGGEVWLSTRLLALRPKPGWDWAEHDDNRVRWVDLPAFFDSLDSDQKVGRDDGFVRVARDPKNDAFLRGVCTQGLTAETQ
jgi:hypothetical protein